MANSKNNFGLTVYESLGELLKDIAWCLNCDYRDTDFGWVNLPRCPKCGSTAIFKKEFDGGK